MKDEGSSALHLFAIELGRLDLVAVLSSNISADINWVDISTDHRPIKVAIIHCQKGIADFLIRGEFKSGIRGKNRSTAIHFAECIGLLVSIYLIIQCDIIL